MVYFFSINNMKLGDLKIIINNINLFYILIRKFYVYIYFSIYKFKYYINNYIYDG